MVDAGSQVGWLYPTHLTRYLRRRWLVLLSRIASISHLSLLSSSMMAGGCQSEVSCEGNGSSAAGRSTL
ncbi:hypothetical protein I7I53_09010 [Histoplasma capsulatum var. duboisii H88]|uniref:Uncharacterized protein n=1 Tax=Ajellomyces capsulatus (strain H88) TaxID=544711 RepID=A0A8A1L3A7_AJEC8|nr:hypothetical protein I7I53_09010 [Histoplasma capsulatum var. duboisii H88]